MRIIIEYGNDFTEKELKMSSMDEDQPGAARLQEVSDCFSRPNLLKEMNDRAFIGLREWETKVVETYFPKSGSVLDIGCGAGREAIALTKQGNSVTGVDVSQAQLELAKANACQAGLEIQFARVDGLHLPEGPYDAIVLWAQLLGNIADPADQRALLENCRRVLRHGGILSASGHHKALCQKESPHATDENWLYPYSWNDLRYHLFTPETFEQLIREAGFTILLTEVPPSLPVILHTIAQR